MSGSPAERAKNLQYSLNYVWESGSIEFSCTLIVALPTGKDGAALYTSYQSGAAHEHKCQCQDTTVATNVLHIICFVQFLNEVIRMNSYNSL